MISFLCLYPQINFAGGGGEPVEAPVYDELLNQISMREAEMLWQAGVLQRPQLEKTSSRKQRPNDGVLLREQTLHG